MIQRWLTTSCGAMALLGVIAISAMPPEAAHAQKSSSKSAEWSYFGGSHRFDRYSPLSQINKDNIGDLQVAWERPSLDASLKKAFPTITPSEYLKGTPLMVDGVLYAPNGVGLVEAFDAKTGKTIWVQAPFAPTPEEADGDSARGVDIWGKGKSMRILSVRGEYLYALDAATGKLIGDFGEGGRVFLRRDTSNNVRFSGGNGPIVVGDVVIIGGGGGGRCGACDGGDTKEAKPEDIRGYDVRTGKQLWTFHLIPASGPARETWGEAAAYTGSMAAWAPLSADDEAGIVYVPTTSPTNPNYGGHRPGHNLYSNSLLALDAKTGELRWHFQMVHHDLWDYDNASPPTLADLNVNGRKIKAVITPNKNGLLYVFDRITGEPVWPIVERTVPQSTIPGEHASPTQPIPVALPPFDQQGLDDDDLIDFTPELFEKAKAIRDRFVTGGLFTPPSLVGEGKKGLLVAPGDWGAANWNTGAFDPDTGYYYANSMSLPTPLGMVKSTKPEETIAYKLDSQAAAKDDPTNPYDFGPDKLPLTKPPYGRITAYDINKGKQVWVAANGDGPRNAPQLKDLNLPPLGNLGRSTALVTKTLLFAADAGKAGPLFSTATLYGHPAELRVFDKQTGEVLKEIALPAGATGGPITYAVSGKQYIVLPIGGGGYGSGWIAYTLKR